MGSRTPTGGPDFGQPLPEPLEPMLALLGDLPPARDDAAWAYEMKWDGVRALGYVERGTVRLISRNRLDMTRSYPELAALGEQLSGRQALLDGEIVAFDEAGRPSFSKLQRRMHVQGKSAAAQLVATDPAVLLVFDLLHLDGESLLAKPYTERRERLEALGLQGPTWHVPPAFHGSGAEAFQASKEQRLEGVVAKRLASKYTPGKRTGDWLKIKNVRAQEVVVGGWKPGAGSREGRIGSLLLGLPDGDALRYIGKVGTGFTGDALDEMSRLFASRRRTTSPFADIPRLDARDAHWIRPDLVGEVAFAEWTVDGRLRHPSWRGWRVDKRPDQVVQETT
jgi:bifunctional non-homologous end joining protein LigD